MIWKEKLKVMAALYKNLQEEFDEYKKENASARNDGYVEIFGHEEIPDVANNINDLNEARIMPYSNIRSRSQEDDYVPNHGELLSLPPIDFSDSALQVFNNVYKRCPNCRELVREQNFVCDRCLTFI